MNEALAQRVLDELYRLNVREIIVCPAGRNAPWVDLLASGEKRFKVWWHFEERSAGFFALGRSRSTAAPVAVCTTSGTAAGELLPVAMEAAYEGVPLVLLTADRPQRFRGSGAPQAAVQPGLFGVYALSEFDFTGVEGAHLPDCLPQGPVHVNVCFEDPNGGNLSAEVDSGGLDAEEFFERYRTPLVVVGGLKAGERQGVRAFLSSLGAPTYFEATSGLREDQSLEPIRLQVGDGLFQRAEQTGYPFDSLIRLGSVPTHRLWRDLEDVRADLPVLSLSSLPFSGLGRPSSLVTGGLPIAPTRAGASFQELKTADARAQSRLDQALQAEPLSEPGLVRSLSERIGPGAMVYLGNSLPIREWDFAATRADRSFEMEASRGLNGIDGQISTFLGLCAPTRGNWAILGDLTTLYDLAAPWSVPALGPEIQATLVILNNGGGRIFNRMFAAKEFQNEHAFGFESWAQMWGLSYRRATSVEAIPEPASGLTVVELIPDQEATARFWEALS